MRILYPVFLVACGALTGYAQPGSYLGGNAGKGLEMNSFPLGTISSFGLVEKTTVGSTYLYDNWQIGSVITDRGEIKDYPVNIDLKSNMVEINTDSGIKALPADRVKRLVIKFQGNGQSVFENAKDYSGSDVTLNGFVEVLSSGEIKLVKHHFSYVREGAYNFALDMGHNQDKILKKSKYYLHANNSLVEIPVSKKKFARLFPEGKQEIIETFIDQNSVSLKNEDDLIALSNFLNEQQIRI